MNEKQQNSVWIQVNDKIHGADSRITAIYSQIHCQTRASLRKYGKVNFTQ